MDKFWRIAEKVVVTFGEAAVAYLVVIPNPTASKTVIAGAIGAGLSAVYNLLRESNPTLPSAPVVTPSEPPAPPAVPAA